mmetsp:Transcript_13849/g.18078  ORF Transcript_13849/g.18078 Transcript_13849/m.18078 type:complete len:157 (-) Transcript_13849:143-613(-)
MARSRRGGGSMMRRPAAPARPAARPMSTAAKPPAPAPQQKSQVPATQSSGGGMLSGLGSTIAQGMAFGTGSAIAHQAVGAITGSMSGGGEAAPAPATNEYASGAMEQNNNSQSGAACATDKQIYYDCLKDNRDDGVMCNFLLEQLKACQQNQMYSS